MAQTPNVGLQEPNIGSNNWGGPLNYNSALLDLIFGGTVPIPALSVTGNVTVGGTLTAGAIAGLSGAFLTTADYNVANGIPQLNAAAKIPGNLLLSGQGMIGATAWGGGLPPSAGTKVAIQVPYAGTITSWQVIADQVGSIQFDVQRCSYANYPSSASIVGSDPPKIVAAQKNEDTGLAGWTTSVSAGDILIFVVTSASTVTWATVMLTIAKE